MIVCFELRRDQYAAVEEMIRRGRFADPSEFVRLALDNQLLREREGVVSDPSTPRQPNPAGSPGVDRSLQVPEVLRLPSSRVQAVEHGLEPQGDDGGERPALWGQINRLLPAKAALRVLCNQASSASDGFVDLREYQALAAAAARSLGLALREIDEAQQRRRIDWLATGFPIGEDASKSVERFVTQFAVQIRRDSRLDGALGQLGFAAVDEKRRRVGVSAAGLRWAMLANPVLDEAAPVFPTLSQDEASFYISHVRNTYAREWELMTTVIDLVGASSSRADIDQSLSRGHSWSAAEAGTMRTGLIGRMSDLGLIQKERDGTSVTYRITKHAIDLLGSNRAEN